MTDAPISLQVLVVPAEGKKFDSEILPTAKTDIQAPGAEPSLLPDTCNSYREVAAWTKRAVLVPPKNDLFFTRSKERLSSRFPFFDSMELEIPILRVKDDEDSGRAFFVEMECGDEIMEEVGKVLIFRNLRKGIEQYCWDVTVGRAVVRIL